MLFFDRFPFFSCRNCQMWKNPQNIVDNVDNCVDNCEDKPKNAVESLGKGQKQKAHRAVEKVWQRAGGNLESLLRSLKILLTLQSL